MTGSTGEHHQVVLVRGRTGAPTTQVLARSPSASIARRPAHVRRTSTADGATELEARNHGNSWSIYFRDPEYNMIEMYVVTPWQVRQPWRVALDLDQRDEEIIATPSGSSRPMACWSSSTNGNVTIADRLPPRADESGDGPA